MFVKPIALIQDEMETIRPLTAELERRRIPFIRFDLDELGYDPSGGSPAYSLVINTTNRNTLRTRGLGTVNFLTKFLHALEVARIPVLNGGTALSFDLSQARQVALFESLHLHTPTTWIVNHPGRLREAAKRLRFPIRFDSDAGDAKIQRHFATESELESAIVSRELDFSGEPTRLLQELIPIRGASSIRLEILGGRYQCALQFDGPGHRNARRVHPTAEIIETAEEAMIEADIDAGFLEYIIDDRDGQPVFVNLSTIRFFPMNAPDELGFDPVVRLVDYIEEANRMGRIPKRQRKVEFTDAEYWDAAI
jgi:hypothetical protein